MVKENPARSARKPQHEGCDVRPVIQPAEGDALDVRLEPTAEDLIEALEDDEHTLPLDAWAERLRQIAPGAYADRPKPRLPALVPPGTEARIRVMQQRVERGEDLFGPGDVETDGIDQAGREIRRCRNGRDERGQLRQLGEKGGDAA